MSLNPVTHTYSTPTLYWDKGGKRQTITTGPPTRGVQALVQHLAQHEYIINTGNMGWKEWEIQYTGRRLEALLGLGAEAYTVVAQFT